MRTNKVETTHFKTDFIHNVKDVRSTALRNELNIL